MQPVDLFGRGMGHHIQTPVDVVVPHTVHQLLCTRGRTWSIWVYQGKNMEYMGVPGEEHGVYGCTRGRTWSIWVYQGKNMNSYSKVINYLVF